MGKQTENRFLVIGTENAGKSVLVSALKDFCKTKSKQKATTGNILDTCPTYGAEIDDFVFKKSKFTLKEVGGTLTDIWPCDYKDVTGVVYVVDVSDVGLFAKSCLFLQQLLRHPDFHVGRRTKPVLLVFSKIDLPHTASKPALLTMFRLEELRASPVVDVSVRETSVVKGIGIEDVLEWIIARTGD